MNSVKTYFLNCDVFCDNTLFTEKLSTAAKYRKEKIEKFRFDSDKRLSLGADVLMKFALGEYANMPVKTNEFGKAYIEGCPLNFNLSHSGSFALIAVSDSEVGCDIQIIEEPPLKVAKRYFCDSEYALIEKSDDKANMFFRLWAIKESYIKMTGTGLSEPLDSFGVRYENDLPIISDDCTTAELDIAPNYCAAVCAYGDAEIVPPVEIKIN